MNFLAHLYLSGDSQEIMVGNFIADHVKGASINTFSDEIQEGIRFHRAIDHFTDSNPLIREAVARLRPGYRKYAGVVMDMYCDHFLAANWSVWSDTELKTFTSDCYKVLLEYDELLPDRTRYMLQYMMKDDWLSAYAYEEGIARALNGMSRRTKFTSNLEKAVETLKEDYAFYHGIFNQFFPQLILFSTDYLENR